MIVSIHQPQYWPWPRYIHKIMSADVFVYLDTVQFDKNGLQKRNQIKTPRGNTWITLPVKRPTDCPIREIQLADQSASKRHWRMLTANYSATPGFQRWSLELQELFNMNTGSLCEVAIASIEWMLEKLDVRTPRIRASALADVTGKGSQLSASICGSLGATSYLTGSGALDYMERADFSAISCEVLVQEWKGLAYNQAHPQAGFSPDLSTLDLLLNCPDTAVQLIQSTGTWQSLWPVE